MQNTTMKWGMIGAVLVLGFIGVALTMRSQTSMPVGMATSTPVSTSTQTHDGVTGTGNFTVSQDGVIDLTPPDFRKPIEFSSTITADVKTALQKAASTLSDRLAKDSLDLKSWINLGTVRKMGGDYKGSEAAWLFVTKAAPQDTIAYNNLGDLYAYYLKDYAKAEHAYLTAIKLNPQEAGAYRELSSLYINVYKKNTSAAEDILRKGIAVAPDSIDMHVILARYYKAAGRTDDAKAQFDAAIAVAQKAGNTDAVTQLKAEENQ
jgi:tetratricopeptide (TPR) repeat protein